jgi:hypothetical protein
MMSSAEVWEWFCRFLGFIFIIFSDKPHKLYIFVKWIEFAIDWYQIQVRIFKLVINNQYRLIDFVIFSDFHPVLQPVKPHAKLRPRAHIDRNRTHKEPKIRQ